jgi:hypothetical protein
VAVQAAQRVAQARLGGPQSSSESPKGTVWCPRSILKPAAILGAPMLLRAQTSPARPQPSGEPCLPSVEPPIWLLRECLTRERMRSHSVSSQEPTHRRTPLHHADPAQSLRAEKVRKQRPDCTLHAQANQ